MSRMRYSILRERDRERQRERQRQIQTETETETETERQTERGFTICNNWMFCFVRVTLRYFKDENIIII